MAKVRSKASRESQRARKRMSPRELAHAEQAAGTITETEVRRREQKIRNRECSSAWSDDIWRGLDRDFPAEAVLRLSGRKEPRVYTGSGHSKIKCPCCHHFMPPTSFSREHGAVCEECRTDNNEKFYRNVQGSNHMGLTGRDG